MSTSLQNLADERHLPLGFLEEYVRVATEDEAYPGWYAFDYPNLTGTWHTRYRNPHPQGQADRWRSAKGAVSHLYNPTLAGPGSSVVWFAEGEIDTLTLVLHGLGAVGLPGASLAANFRKEWKYLFDTGFVIVAFDNDEAGQAAAGKAAHVFAPRSTILRLPEGMDISDYWISDPDGLKGAIMQVRQENGLA